MQKFKAKKSAIRLYCYSERQRRISLVYLVVINSRSYFYYNKDESRHEADEYVEIYVGKTKAAAVLRSGCCGERLFR